MISNNNNNNQAESEKSTNTVKAPWIVSQKGAVYCKWQNLPDEIRSQLKMENDFKKMIGKFSYHVRRTGDGNCIIFRNTPRDHKYGFTKRSTYRLVEIQILPIEQANKLLATSTQFEVIGKDPIKVINQQFFAVLGRKDQDNQIKADLECPNCQELNTQVVQLKEALLKATKLQTLDGILVTSSSETKEQQ